MNNSRKMGRREKSFVCAVCGNSFTSTCSIAKYCSDTCRRKKELSNQDVKKIARRGKEIRDIRKELRDLYGDACPVCGYFRKGIKRHSLEAHHIHPVSLGGETTMDNMILLCANCHREAHSGLLTENDLHDFQKNAEEEYKINIPMKTELEDKYYRSAVWVGCLLGEEYDWIESLDFISKRFNIPIDTAIKHVLFAVGIAGVLDQNAERIGYRKSIIFGRLCDIIASNIRKAKAMGIGVKQHHTVATVN